MSRRVLIHVGTPKTGTSHLQDVLFRNRDRLAEQGVLYPADRFDAHFLAGARPDAAAVGRPGERGGRRVGRAGRAGPRAFDGTERDHQPRDPRDRVARPGPAGAGVAGPPRHRDPRRAVGARPGAPDPRGVAGERQAPARAALRAVPRPGARPGPRQRDRLVVLGRAGDPRHPRPLGRRPAARRTCTW